MCEICGDDGFGCLVGDVCVRVVDFGRVFIGEGVIVVRVLVIVGVDDNFMIG